MNIADIIRYIGELNGLSINFLKDVIIYDEGKGAYIKEWNLPIQKPTHEELMELESTVKDWLKSKEYIANRKSEYPSIQDQLDMLYWDKINGTNNWQDKITEIKEKYPKQ